MKKKIGVSLLVIGLFGLVGCQEKKEDAVESQKKESVEDGLVGVVKEADFFVDAPWVKSALDEEGTVVIEASYGEGESYEKGHLPQAIHMDTMEIETEENHWNILDAKDCATAFLAKGVTKDSQLIVYSEDINAAARVAFVAYWLGVEKVKLLDGGLAAWERAGYELDKGIIKGTKATDFGVEVPARPDYLIKTAEDLVAAQAKNPELVLASIRSWEEFIGKTSGYGYIENAGEPLGAVYAKSSKSSADVAYLITNDGTIKEPTAIFNDWQKWGITPDKQVAFYCGTGWRAATAFFICQQEGWENVQLYDGGWYDWDLAYQKDPSNYPVQVGDPRDPETLEIKK